MSILAAQFAQGVAVAHADRRASLQIGQAKSRPPRFSRVKLVKFKLKFLALCALLWLHSLPAAGQLRTASWVGTLLDAEGKFISGGQVELRESASGRTYTANTNERGGFSFPDLLPGTYEARVHWQGKVATPALTRGIRPGERLTDTLQI